MMTSARLPLVAKGSTAVMAQRREPPDALDYFPTPPWATRALFRHVLPALDVDGICSVWEPACGEGHMAAVIEEFAGSFSQEDQAGLNKLRFTGRLHGRTLKPGRYLLRVTAKRQGQKSRRLTARFTILPPPPVFSDPDDDGDSDQPGQI